MAREKDKAMDWALTQAQKEFRKVFAMALKDGPQEIRGDDAAVIVIRKEDYIEPPAVSGRSIPNFADYLLHIPQVEGLDVARDKSTDRDISL